MFKWLGRGGGVTGRAAEAAAASVKRGNAALAEGRLEAAAASYREAVAADAGHAGAWVNLGFVLKELGQWEAARGALERAVEVAPGNADARYLLGLVLEERGDLEEAIRHLRAAVESRPDFVFAWRDLCRAHLRGGQIEAVELAAAQGIAANPAAAELHYLLGNVHLQRKDCLTALQCYERALALTPDFAEALNNRGLALHELQRYEEALSSYGRALELKEAFAEAHFNRGNALKQLGRHEEAVTSYDRAIELDPGVAGFYNNRGLELHELGRLDAALASYGQAIGLEPGYADAHWNRSLTLLLRGAFSDGWQDYEWRWRRTAMKDLAPVYCKPLWMGEGDLRGKTILLHAEQGLGDTLQFCRYVRQVAALGAQVVLEVQPPLVPLLWGMKGVVELVGRGARLPDYDCHCPLLSLPLAFKTGLAEMTGEPYLEAPPGNVAAWQARMGARRAPRVGLVWSGSTWHQNDHNRSIPFAEFRRTLHKDVDYFCLQKEIRPSDRAILAEYPVIKTFEEELRDFADTAALITLMDWVIAVDTSAAHLAGALGKEVWLLLPYMPDWRWLLDRKDSPWYDSARLFRQPAAGDWESVLREVERMTAERLAERN
ncbi:MAG: tetratricopeptide repeat protein [Burkholderiales bacterium]|nr:tetratricopeptide repeat protein [Burkholderiales bacterium]